MLAYYTSLVKKEELLEKLSSDGKRLASISNDLVCCVKEYTAACDVRDIEHAQKAIYEAEELSKIVVAMITNTRTNYDSYISSLVPQKEEEKQEVVKQENQIQTDSTQLSTLLEAMKSLKEMKDSLGENKKV